MRDNPAAERPAEAQECAALGIGDVRIERRRDVGDGVAIESPV